MRVIAIIQARMGSTRLPGKVMKRLEGKSVLGHVISRVRACAVVDDVVVATTDKAEDDVLVREAVREKAAVFRGSETDVLDRYLQAAKKWEAEYVVRITSDCPLVDPGIIARMVCEFRRCAAGTAPADYMSNGLERTFPRGLDTEIMTLPALETAWKEAARPHEREHVTPYFYENPEKFEIRGFQGDIDYSSYRWTLDTPEDWEVISAMYRDLYDPEGDPFDMERALTWAVDNAKLARLNAHVEQKALAER